MQFAGLRWIQSMRSESGPKACKLKHQLRRHAQTFANVNARTAIFGEDVSHLTGGHQGNNVGKLEMDASLLLAAWTSSLVWLSSLRHRLQENSNKKASRNELSGPTPETIQASSRSCYSHTLHAWLNRS